MGICVQSIEYALQHHGNYRDDGYVILEYGLIDDNGIKFVVDHHADAIDNAAHQDGEATDMEERKTSEPAITGTVPKVERRANGIPPLHAIGDDRTFRQSSSARCVDNGLWNAEVDKSAKGNLVLR